MAFSRRAFIAGLVALATFVSGCSSSPKEGGDNPSGGATGKVETRVVKDIDDKDVTVPAHPKRVVSLSEPTLDNLIALGVKPIGAVAGRGQRDVSPYIKPMTKGVKLLGNVAQPNFEAIGAAKPDLILVDGTSINNNPPILEALRKIAPLVYTGLAGGNWRDNFRLTADAMNMKDKGEEVLKQYDARVAAVKKKLTPFKDETFSVVRWQGSSASLILKELPPGVALSDLGLKRPPSQDHRGRGHSDPVSLENLERIDADWIFFGTLGGSSVSNPDNGGDAGIQGAKDALKEAEQVPGFTKLKAYKEHHIIPVQGAAWTSTGGPILMNHIVDDVEKFAQEHKP